ncbi:hypothetical protein C7E12_23355, partial [Stenotrophomonas maltophilia]
AILSRVSGGKAYDLATEYYVGMPSWQDAGDPHYHARAILSRVSGGKAYDLATEYYVGMPSWQDAGDPH